MEIDFSKIKQTPIKVNFTKNSSSIVGSLERINRNSVKLTSIFNLSVKVICNRCGKEVDKKLNYPLELILSEGRYNSNDEIDVIEFFDGKIDFNYLIESEIASIKEDYNYCDNCINNNEILEIEF